MAVSPRKKKDYEAENSNILGILTFSLMGFRSGLLDIVDDFICSLQFRNTVLGLYTKSSTKIYEAKFIKH